MWRLQYYENLLIFDAEAVGARISRNVRAATLQLCNIQKIIQDSFLSCYISLKLSKK